MPFVPYSFWEKRPKSGGVSPADSAGELLDKNNVLWAADVAFVLRPGARVYGEFLLDDLSFSSDYKPDMIGYQAGAEWRRALGQGAIGAAAEYSRIHNFVYSVWHHHDFDFNGFPTGYVLGPDVQALSGEATLEWDSNWELRARGELHRKGEGSIGDAFPKTGGLHADAAKFQGVVERETRMSATLIYAPKRWLRLEATGSVYRIKNLDHVSGRGGDGAAVRLGERIEW
jgi:hypothetical protein